MTPNLAPSSSKHRLQSARRRATARNAITHTRPTATNPHPTLRWTNDDADLMHLIAVEHSWDDRIYSLLREGAL